MAKDKSSSGIVRSSVSGGNGDIRGRSRPASTGPVNGSTVEVDEDAANPTSMATIKNVLGDDYERKLTEMATLPGSRVVVSGRSSKYGPNTMLDVDVFHPSISYGKNLFGSMQTGFQFRIFKTEQGNKVGSVSIHATGTGDAVGTKVVSNWFQNHKRMGIDSYSVTAAGSGEQAKATRAKNEKSKKKSEVTIGYQIWARMGMDGDLKPNEGMGTGPSKVYKTFRKKLDASPFKGANRVSDIVSKPDGVNWWKENGVPFDSEGSFSGEDAKRVRAFIKRVGGRRQPKQRR